MTDRYLFLDDERVPGDVTWCVLPNVKFDIVRNYAEFVDYVTLTGVPSYISFDHDLADVHYEIMLKDAIANSTGQLAFEVAETIVDVDYGPEKTGYDCAKWLVAYCYNNNHKFPECSVHSMNPVGKERIERYITNAQQHLEI